MGICVLYHKWDLQEVKKNKSDTVNGQVFERPGLIVRIPHRRNIMAKYPLKRLLSFSQREEDMKRAQQFMTGSYNPVNTLDLLQFQGSNLIGGMLNEVFRLVPEYSGENPYFGNSISVPARNIADKRFETLVRTEVPRGDHFRLLNEPVGTKKAKREKREFEMFPFLGYWEADEQMLEFAADGGAALMRDDAQAILQGLVMDLGEYFYYGQTETDKKMFPGILQQMPNNRTFGHGGTGNKLSSIYFMWLDPGLQGVSWLHGNNGVIQTTSPVHRTKDVGDGKKPIVEQSIRGWMGLQVLHKESVLRIANIDTTSAFASNVNMEVVTDELLSAAKMRFPTFMIPNLYAFMRPEVFRLWRASKPPLMDTGFAPPISEFSTFEGIRIVVTESIKEHEGLIANVPTL